MNTEEVARLYEEFVLPTYARSPLCLVKGKGAKVWDLHGREYLDFFSGWAVSGLGHCHPKVLDAIRDQAGKILHVPNNYFNVRQAQLAAEISKASFPARVFFCNSGAEATDTAVKFARRWGRDQGRFEIITMKQSFHGRTLAGIAATGQDKVREGYDPVLAGFRYADFNDLASVKDLVTAKTAAIFLEPVQGEGGVNVATEAFLKGLRGLCDERGLLLILDEVQTGMGRTGKMFAYQHYGIEPDLMTLAKSLGGGLPIGALVVSRKISREVFTPGSHGSTFGGNPLVTAAALAVFRAIRKEKLLENVVRLGEYLGERLEGLRKKFQIICEVRGLGFMRGLELRETGVPLVDRAREKRLLINCTQEKVLRIFPPMTMTKSLLDRGLGILEEVFRLAQG